MSTATGYSKLGYLSIIKETTAGTPLYTTEPIEILSESIVTNWDYTTVSPIAGHRSANHHSVLNRVGPSEGTIEMYADFESIGHFFNGVFGEDTVTTLAAGVSVQHDWEPLNTLVTYTMDIKMGGEDYITRYFGVRVKSVTLSIEDNKAKLSIAVVAQRVFSCARVLVAASSGTALRLDQTSGLTTSDILIMLDEATPSTSLQELTITTVTDETTLVTSTIQGAGAALAVDDIAVIKAQTILPEDYTRANEAIFSGGAEAYIGTGSNNIQNLGAKTNVEDFEITVENDLEPRWSATGADVIDRMPSTVLLKGVTVSGKFSQFHIDPDFLDKLRKNEQVGLRFQFLGALLQANSAASATGVLESDGTGTVTTTVTAADEDGNDWAIIVVQGTTTLSASLSNKLITVTLDATPANNTVALVASAIDGLANVTAVAASTGNVTVADNPNKVEFTAGRDASEVELLRFDLPNVRLNPFNANLGADDTIMEDIEFTALRDPNDDREIKVRLRNGVATY